MATKKDLKSIYEYKPSNPRDPKMPSLERTSDYNNGSSFDDSDFYFESSIGVNDSSKNSQKEDNSSVLIDGLEDSKKNASNVIAKIKGINETTKTLEEKTNEELFTSEIVMPDPTSELNIFNAFANRKYRALEEMSRTKEIIKNTRGEVRLKLTEKEVKKILETFRSKVVKVTQKEVVIKNNKYGFEIYRNSSDKRYWVAASCFEEIWDPKKNSYVNLWSGNSFTGYGYHDFDQVINQTITMMTKGKTGSIIWRDFVTGWSKQKNRFYASDTPTQFTYSEYKKIVKWYRENKIWILVKQAKVKDIEDLMEENKMKRKTGEPISAMSTIQAKLLEPPRRASLVFGYPVKDPNYKGKDYANPENKLYEIGFAFTE
ncbi:hypothetical protein [Spiroplasma monobiae]|uniref:Uncharacterized protein n=1 Tax=Spiroplasma monobiae MQ-1 TaxID=1336748 RepID=A0A2K9LYN7_SPISQ|nr:hypothetical protein [Spiroplasma monobiae]AUM62864.1 hypothetical protein SMONO_v1c06150 [Spiroplasma monobiae MQ-1]